MAVQNIECKLVQAQLSMIVAGEKFPADVLEDVDDHLKVCAECREALAEKKRDLRRRLVLQESEPIAAKLGAPNVNLAGNTVPAAYAPTHAVIEVEEDEPVSEKKIKQWKPAVYSVGLALVLVAMSWIARDPSRIFGERASTEFSKPSTSVSSLPAATIAAPESPWIDRPAPNSVSPPQTGPRVESSPTPTTHIKRKPLARNRKPIHRVAKRNSGVKIYDSNGKPIQ